MWMAKTEYKECLVSSYYTLIWAVLDSLLVNFLINLLPFLHSKPFVKEANKLFHSSFKKKGQKLPGEATVNFFLSLNAQKAVAYAQREMITCVSHSCVCPYFILGSEWLIGPQCEWSRMNCSGEESWIDFPFETSVDRETASERKTETEMAMAMNEGYIQVNTEQNRTHTHTEHERKSRVGSSNFPPRVERQIHSRGCLLQMRRASVKL